MCTICMLQVLCSCILICSGWKFRHHGIFDSQWWSGWSLYNYKSATWKTLFSSQPISNSSVDFNSTAMDMDPAMRLSMKAPTGEINHITDIMNISTHHVLECNRECMARENCTFFVYSKQEQQCGLYKDDEEHGNVIQCSQDMFCYFVWV
ncbi:uncharacterized protein LOC134723419 [Mytilus trossulus]|uniref:uncharacterized protein LOC134723419 n=1 Tax=Mytilus trossulus TaxID=6551 RepID=UPI0030043699